MSDRALELAARRNALRAHCDVQRSYLADTVRQIESRLAGVDRGIEIIQRFAHKPLLIAAGVGVIALLGPRRLLRWAGRSAFLFASGKRLLRLIRR
jgi:hypothetical protein